MDYDVVIIGGGPAGLTAGSHLAQSGYRALVLEKESFGGRLMSIESVANCPDTDALVPGPKLGAELADQAAANGADLKQGEVVEIENYAHCKSVTCADGAAYTCSMVIVASGLRYKKLGVPGEHRLDGKGLIHCAVCDGSLYRDRVVVVCGGGDAGIIEALYLAKYASKVHVIEAQPELTAKSELRQRALAEEKLAIRCGTRAIDIMGDQEVTGVQVENASSGVRETINAYGVLIHVGFEPATDFADYVLRRDDQGYIETNEESEAELPGILLAGDVKRGSSRNVCAAIDDGRNAALAAKLLLQALATAS